MKTYPAEWFTLQEDLAIIRYFPDEDMHFPLKIVENCDWAILCFIVAPGQQGRLNYMVFLRSYNGRSAPNTLVIENQFGSIRLLFGSSAPLEAIEKNLAALAVSSLLRVIGKQDLVIASTIMKSLSPYLSLAIDTVEKIMGESVTGYLVVKDLRRATYIVPLDDKNGAVYPVQKISMEVGDSIRTVLECERIAKGSSFLLLHPGDFFILSCENKKC